MHRVIIFGRIEFKNMRSVGFARTEFQRHSDTIAKYDTLLRPEAIFGDDPEVPYEELSITFDRELFDANDKTLNNTIQGIKVLLQFAMAGRVDVFILEAGDLPRQRVLTVTSEKKTVHAFAAGVEALEEKRYTDAVGPLSDAIGSFARHPWAHEARGQAYYELGRLNEAERDFQTALKLYAGYPGAHLGLARIAYAGGRNAATFDSLERAMKYSIPHQPGYWISALLKAQVMLDMVERERGDDPSAAAGYLSSAKSLLNRYDSKLRQLGSARSHYYPTPDDVQALWARARELEELVGV